MRRRIFEPEHELFREQARRFFQKEIGPRAAQWREQGYDRGVPLGRGGLPADVGRRRYGPGSASDFRYEQILYEENVRHGEFSSS
jgi:acyl-CoA dehydrogenase